MHATHTQSPSCTNRSPGSSSSESEVFSILNKLLERMGSVAMCSTAEKILINRVKTAVDSSHGSSTVSSRSADGDLRQLCAAKEVIRVCFELQKACANLGLGIQSEQTGDKYEGIRILISNPHHFTICLELSFCPDGSHPVRSLSLSNQSAAGGYSCDHMLHALQTCRFELFERHLKGMQVMFPKLDGTAASDLSVNPLTCVDELLRSISFGVADDNDVSDAINRCEGGHLSERLDGIPPCLTYMRTPSFDVSERLTEKRLGYSIDSDPAVSGRFSFDIIPCLSPGSFYLSLQEPMPLLLSSLDQIEDITSLKNSDLESVRCGKQKNLVELLLSQSIKNKNRSLLTVSLPGQRHRVSLCPHSHSHLTAVLATRIQCSSVDQLPDLIDCLRRQAYLNTLILSCLENGSALSPAISHDSNSFRYDVSVADSDELAIMFQWPNESAGSFIKLTIRLGTKHVFDASCSFANLPWPDPDEKSSTSIIELCPEWVPTRVLRVSWSIPVVMRSVLQKLLNEPMLEAPRPEEVSQESERTEPEQRETDGAGKPLKSMNAISFIKEYLEVDRLNFTEFTSEIDRRRQEQQDGLNLLDILKQPTTWEELEIANPACPEPARPPQQQQYMQDPHVMPVQPPPPYAAAVQNQQMRAEFMHPDTYYQSQGGYPAQMMPMHSSPAPGMMSPHNIPPQQNMNPQQMAAMRRQMMHGGPQPGQGPPAYYGQQGTPMQPNRMPMHPGGMQSPMMQQQSPRFPGIRMPPHMDHRMASPIDSPIMHNPCTPVTMLCSPSTPGINPSPAPAHVAAGMSPVYPQACAVGNKPRHQSDVHTFQQLQQLDQMMAGGPPTPVGQHQMGSVATPQSAMSTPLTSPAIAGPGPVMMTSPGAVDHARTSIDNTIDSVLSGSGCSTPGQPGGRQKQRTVSGQGQQVPAQMPHMPMGQQPDQQMMRQISSPPGNMNMAGYMTSPTQPPMSAPVRPGQMQQQQQPFPFGAMPISQGQPQGRTGTSVDFDILDRPPHIAGEDVYNFDASLEPDGGAVSSMSMRGMIPHNMRGGPLNAAQFQRSVSIPGGGTGMQPLAAEYAGMQQPPARGKGSRGRRGRAARAGATAERAAIMTPAGMVAAEPLRPATGKGSRGSRKTRRPRGAMAVPPERPMGPAAFNPGMPFPGEMPDPSLLSPTGVPVGPQGTVGNPGFFPPQSQAIPEQLPSDWPPTSDVNQQPPSSSLSQSPDRPVSNDTAGTQRSNAEDDSVSNSGSITASKTPLDRGESFDSSSRPTPVESVGAAEYDEDSKSSVNADDGNVFDKLLQPNLAISEAAAALAQRQTKRKSISDVIHNLTRGVPVVTEQSQSFLPGETEQKKPRPSEEVPSTQQGLKMVIKLPPSGSTAPDGAPKSQKLPSTFSTVPAPSVAAKPAKPSAKAASSVAAVSAETKPAVQRKTKASPATQVAQELIKSPTSAHSNVQQRLATMLKEKEQQSRDTTMTLSQAEEVSKFDKLQVARNEKRKRQNASGGASTAGTAKRSKARKVVEEPGPVVTSAPAGESSIENILGVGSMKMKNFKIPKLDEAAKQELLADTRPGSTPSDLSAKTMIRGAAAEAPIHPNRMPSPVGIRAQGMSQAALNRRTLLPGPEGPFNPGAAPRFPVQTGDEGPRPWRPHGAVGGRMGPMGQQAGLAMYGTGTVDPRANRGPRAGQMRGDVTSADGQPSSPDPNQLVIADEGK